MFWNGQCNQNVCKAAVEGSVSVLLYNAFIGKCSVLNVSLRETTSFLAEPSEPGWSVQIRISSDSWLCFLHLEPSYVDLYGYTGMNFCISRTHSFTKKNKSIKIQTFLRVIVAVAVALASSWPYFCHINGRKMNWLTQNMNFWLNLFFQLCN